MTATDSPGLNGIRDRITRRHALKIAGATIASTALSAPQPPTSSAAPPARRTKRVLIAGGGIGGLCCGYELMKLGHDVTVLEASGRTGGHVFTVRDPLADGLYADAGAEHFTKPGYEIYRKYVEEFGLPAVKYPRRKDVIRFIHGKMYTEEMLADREVLKKFGFNRTEVDYLSQNPWWDLPSLYYGPYLDVFEDEYQPFGVGHDDLEQVSALELLQRDGASGAAQSFIGKASISALYALWYAAIKKIRGVPVYPTDASAVPLLTSNVATAASPSLSRNSERRSRWTAIFWSTAFHCRRSAEYLSNQPGRRINNSSLITYRTAPTVAYCCSRAADSGKRIASVSTWTSKRPRYAARGRRPTKFRASGAC